MTLNDLMDYVGNVLPNATVGQDDDGQVIIYTDKTLNNKEELIPFSDPIEEAKTS